MVLKLPFEIIGLALRATPLGVDYNLDIDETDNCSCQHSDNTQDNTISVEMHTGVEGKMTFYFFSLHEFFRIHFTIQFF